MVKRFEGKTVLVSGGAGGLGAEQCRVFAEEGANVAVNYLNVGSYAEAAAELAQRLKDHYGGDHRCFSADITNEKEVEGMIHDIISHYGKIDILVNNAGIFPVPEATWKISTESWSKALAVNMTGALQCSKAVLKGMLERRYGRIIHISSIIGLQGALGVIAYAATKAALVGMCKTMAKEVAKQGITVNCVAPGFIDAGMLSEVAEKYTKEVVLPAIPMGHLGEAIDIAKAVAFLASDDAKYITGEVLRVDGGQAM